VQDCVKRDIQASVQFAVSVLGDGVKVSAQDTVPFALRCVGERLSDYEEATVQLDRLVNLSGA